MTRPDFLPARRTGGGVGAQTSCPPGDPDSPAGTATTQTGAPRQWRIGDPHPGGRLVLIITELPETLEDTP